MENQWLMNTNLVKMINIFLILFFGLTNPVAYEVPDSNNAVLIIPGGAYKIVGDGVQYAQWLNKLGISACILNYRPNPYPFPMQDATEAFKRLKKQYKTVGVLGSSAGGHLAASIQIYDPNCKPDFLILLFPVISLTKPYRHKDCWKMLFSDNPDQNLLELYSVEEQVTKNNPPAFIISGSKDKSVPAENAIDYYLHLRKNGVPAELHIFQEVKHGFWNKEGYHALGVEGESEWTKLCENWLKKCIDI